MTTTTTPTSLTITRTIAAPPQRVYDAWIDPAVRKTWWAAAPGMTCDLCDLDTRVGGRYRINMKNPDGKEFITVGEFVEVDPPRRLVFTWTWENACDEEAGVASVDTLVTVAIEPEADGTHVTVTHERFTSEASRDEHNGGWTGCLDNFIAVMEADAA